MFKSFITHSINFVLNSDLYKILAMILFIIPWNVCHWVMTSMSLLSHLVSPKKWLTIMHNKMYIIATQQYTFQSGKILKHPMSYHWFYSVPNHGRYILCLMVKLSILCEYNHYNTINPTPQITEFQNCNTLMAILVKCKILSMKCSLRRTGMIEYNKTKDKNVYIFCAFKWHDQFVDESQHFRTSNDVIELLWKGYKLFCFNEHRSGTNKLPFNSCIEMKIRTLLEIYQLFWEEYSYFIQEIMQNVLTRIGHIVIDLFIEYAPIKYRCRLCYLLAIFCLYHFHYFLVTELNLFLCCSSLCLIGATHLFGVSFEYWMNTRVPTISHCLSMFGVHGLFFRFVCGGINIINWCPEQ